MSLFGSLKTCLVTKSFSISGRASGSEFWWFMLFFISVYTASEVYAHEILNMIPYNMRTVYKFASLAVIIYLSICAATVIVRRLHDTDRSGWFVCMLLFLYATSVLYEHDVLHMIPRDMRTFFMNAVMICLVIYAVITLLCGRHYKDKSGWFVLMPFILKVIELMCPDVFMSVKSKEDLWDFIIVMSSFFMSVWLFIICIHHGTPGYNSYGAPPSGSAAERLYYKESVSKAVKADRRENYRYR